jgi:hypothetical protein
MMMGSKAEALVAFAQARLDEALTAGSEPIPAFRQALREGRQRLFDAFDQGVPAADLVRTHSLLVDSVLTRAWARHLPPTSPGALPLALVAVGGYGRGELHPGSDLDILILLGEEAKAKAGPPSMARWRPSSPSSGTSAPRSARASAPWTSASRRRGPTLPS